MPNFHYVTADDMVKLADFLREKAQTNLPLSFPDGFISAVFLATNNIENNIVKNWLEGNALNISWNFEMPYIPSYCFAGYCNSDMASITISKCKHIFSSAFYGCKYLEFANFPQCEYIEESAFYSCENLKILSIPKCKRIDTYAFGKCKNLNEIYLNSSSVVYMPSPASYVFDGTPFLSGIGSIYVPSKLLSDYLSDDHWMNLDSSCFIGI
jgi:hypothetical protein